MGSRIHFAQLTRESSFAVWLEFVTCVVRTKDVGQWLQRVPITAADREQL